MSYHKKNLSKVVIDIETVGKELNDLDPISQEAINKEAKRQDYDEEQTRMKTNVSPLTGEVVTIGMYNPDTQKGQILYQTGEDFTDKEVEDDIEYVPGTEEEILKTFWDKVSHYASVITFNGRRFDIPYLLIRSAVHRIEPTKNLLPNRYYSIPVHIDLYDQMTFYQTSGGRGMNSLHFFCKAFGIDSPKEGEVDGYSINEYYQKGEYKKIAGYNLKDLKATAELYRYWEEYLAIK